MNIAQKPVSSNLSMTMPSVSVILPTYNRAYVLGRAIKSVLDQTFTDFELIVVDDGSTDSTEEVLRSFDDPRIRFLRHEQNHGVSAARNTGIRAARGEYIAFNDSDDEWLPTKLERQMELFDHDTTGNLGIVTCGGILKYETGTRRFIPQAHLLNYEELLYNRQGFSVGTPMLLIKRSFAGRELYFDEYLLKCVDWDLAVRLSRIVSIGAVAEPLIKIDRTVGGIKLTINVANAYLAILQKYAVELKARPNVLGFHHKNIALSYYNISDMKQARHHFKEAIRVYRRQPVTYFYFTSSLFGHFGLCLCLKMQRFLGLSLRRIKSQSGVAKNPLFESLKETVK